MPRFLERLNARGASNHITGWKHSAGVIYQRFENISQALHKCVMETWLSLRLPGETRFIRPLPHYVPATPTPTVFPLFAFLKTTL